MPSLSSSPLFIAKHPIQKSEESLCALAVVTVCTNSKLFSIFNWIPHSLSKDVSAELVKCFKHKRAEGCREGEEYKAFIRANLLKRILETKKALPQEFFCWGKYTSCSERQKHSSYGRSNETFQSERLYGFFFSTI